MMMFLLYSSFLRFWFPKSIAAIVFSNSLFSLKFPPIFKTFCFSSWYSLIKLFVFWNFLVDFYFSSCKSQWTVSCILIMPLMTLQISSHERLIFRTSIVTISDKFDVGKSSMLITTLRARFFRKHLFVLLSYSWSFVKFSCVKLARFSVKSVVLNPDEWQFVNVSFIETFFCQQYIHYKHKLSLAYF